MWRVVFQCNHRSRYVTWKSNSYLRACQPNLSEKPEVKATILFSRFIFVDSKRRFPQPSSNAPMTDVKSLFKEEELAALYKKYRPDLKEPIVRAIIDFLAKKFNPSECDAVDVGCGSGQGTIPLAPFLRHIVGLDPSEAQINQIKTQDNLPENVEFRVGEAEALPFKDSSLQLVTVKAALHWFDISKFFQEVDRVLQPGGVLVVLTGTGFGTIIGHEEEAKKLLLSVAEEYRTPEWTAKAGLVLNDYKDVNFPYEECIRDDSFTTEHSITIQNIMQVMTTRSDVAKFLREYPEEAQKVLKDTEEKLMKIVGATGRPEDTTVLRESKQTLILCRKP